MPASARIDSVSHIICGPYRFRNALLTTYLRMATGGHQIAFS